MNVQLHCGDCLDILPSVGKVDAVITDPPYLTGNSGITYRNPGVTDVQNDTSVVGMPWGYDLKWIDVAAKLQPSHWIVYANYKMLSTLLPALERHAVIACIFMWRKINAPQMTRPVPRLDSEFIVWAKARGATNGRMSEFDSMVLDVPMPQAGCFASERILVPGTGQAAHPTQKPLAVVLPFVDRLPIASVLDPFMGTGTTREASVKIGREFIGIEKQGSYYDMARRRIEAAQQQIPLFEMTA